MTVNRGREEGPLGVFVADRLGLLEGRCDFDNATYFLSQITIVPGDAAHASAAQSLTPAIVPRSPSRVRSGCVVRVGRSAFCLFPGETKTGFGPRALPF